MNWHILCGFIISIFSIHSSAIVISQLQLLGSRSFGDSAISAEWCDDCNLLAVGGQNSTGADGLIEIYRFTPASNKVDLVVTWTMPNNICYSLDWCGDCQFIASDEISTTPADWGKIHIYQFNETTSSLDPVGTSTQFHNFINSVAWYNNCHYLAAQWTYSHNSYIQLYRFNPDHPGDLVATPYTYTLPGGLRSYDVLKWCGNSNYLVSASDMILAVYEFNPDTEELTLTYSVQTDNSIYSVDICENCAYIATAGWNHPTGYCGLAVYKFDPSSADIFLPVTSITFGEYFTISLPVRWCGCDTLIAGNQINDPPYPNYYLFHFDQHNLSTIQTINTDSIPNTGAWCGNCDYFVAGGYSETGLVQLYKKIDLAAPTILSAQQTSHRFPTQIDLVNTICWQPVADAVAYKVYADTNLTTLLTTITQSPYCYSQHQIMRGIKKTYYVTAVAADGNESMPTAITV